MARPVVVQFGPGVMKPFQPRALSLHVDEADVVQDSPPVGTPARRARSGRRWRSRPPEVFRRSAARATWPHRTRRAVNTRSIPSVHICAASSTSNWANAASKGSLREPADLSARVLDRVAVFLARRTLGGAQLDELEQRVTSETGEKLLSRRRRSRPIRHANHSDLLLWGRHEHVARHSAARDWPAFHGICKSLRARR